MKNPAGPVAITVWSSLGRRLRARLEVVPILISSVEVSRIPVRIGGREIILDDIAGARIESAGSKIDRRLPELVRDI